MSGKKRHRVALSAKPWEGKRTEEFNPAETIIKVCHRDIYRYRHASSDLEGEAEFFNAYIRDACPECGSKRIEGKEFHSNGVRR